LKKGNIFFLVVMIMAPLFLFSCGKKAPPFLPSQVTDLTVEHLEAEWRDDVLVLKGDVKGALSSVKGCRLYHAGYAIEDSPCRGCPVNFAPVREVEGKVVSENGFYCEFAFPREKGVHFFSVALLDGKGGAGPLSERTDIILDD